MALEPKDYLVIKMLLNTCYKNRQSCKSALLKIDNYQREAAVNKKFSCQTRLLGLEANLIMAMNSNLKRNDAIYIIDGVRKYC